MAKPRYMLEWTLRTYCVGCGIQLGCTSQIAVAEPVYAKQQHDLVARKIEQMKGECPGCEKKQPKVPLKWVETIGSLF